MSLHWLDHVNIRTARLAEMVRFYTRVLGLEEGERPPFPFGGSWLYCGEKAAVHLVETPSTPAGTGPRIEHFAFRASDLVDFLDRLGKHGVDYDITVVPGLELTQVNVRDPDGNHIEIAFEPHERAQ